MSDYTPTIEQVRRYWLYGANAWADGVARADDQHDPATGDLASAQFDRWLATVTANPNNAAQVETVARALFDRSVEVAFGATWHGQPEGVREAFRMDARAVLAALAEAVGGVTDA